MVRYTLTTQTVAVATAGGAMGSSYKVQIEFVDATVVNEKINMGGWVSSSDLRRLDIKYVTCLTSCQSFTFVQISPT